MADTRAPTNKLAMSKALGAAFLNHQVEQLEKSVSGNGPTGNWRDRRSRAPPATQEYSRAGNYNNSRRPASGGGPRAVRAKGGAPDKTESTFSEGRERTRGEWDREKDADIVVVDASVLVHALPQVKKWCRDGRQEIVIVPLEALNTLDLLKKGSTQLAQRARAASRILEAQVGTNPRIRVQRDDAFVLWDSIPFRELPAIPTTTSSVPSPEWVRRTVCCARWEFEHASLSPATPAPASDSDDSKKKPKIILAVLASSPDDTPAATQAQDAPISASPVPLPAPQPNRFEPRAAGTFVAHWAARAGVELFRVPPMSLSDTHGHGGHGGRRSPEEERATRGATGAYGNGNGNGTYGGGGDFARTGNGGGGGGRGRRNSHHRDGGRATTPNSHGGGGLVERPPAVMAMMEMVSQPSRVVRVLARGEKLDPN